MKNKKLFAILTLVCFLFTLMPVAAFAGTEDTVILKIDSKNVYKNGEVITTDVAPTIVDGRTMVPVRVIMEALGGEVDWDADNRIVTIHIDGKVLRLVIDKEIADFGTGAIIIDGRTMVPIRYISEYAGYEVEWVESTRQVIITKAEQAVEYTVSFDMNTGSEGVFKTVTVKAGQTVEKPEIEYKSGKVFHGWYTNDEGKGDVFDFSTPIYSDLTLYGHWSAQSYSGGHSHVYGAWESNGDGTHSKTCTCGKALTEKCTEFKNNKCVACGQALTAEIAQANGVVNTVDNATDLATALTMGGNVVLAEDITTEEISIPEGVEVTLDLNGNTLTGADRTAGDGSASLHNVIKNNGELIITGEGTIRTRNLTNNPGAKLVIDGDITIIGGAAAGGSAIWNEGDCTINGATIIQNTNVSNYAIKNTGNANATMVINDANVTGIHGALANDCGSMTINGGSFTVTGQNGSDHVIYAPDGTVIINDGKFTHAHDHDDATSGGSAIICDVKNIVINGGTFDSVRAAFAYADETDITINGGTFLNKATTVYNSTNGVSDFVADGYEAVKVGESVVVLPSEGAVEANDATVLSAALSNGNDVTLGDSIEDAPVDTTAPYGNYYGVALNGGVLDGNGKTLDFDSDTGDNYGIMTSGGTIKNMTITGVFRAIMIMNPTETVYIDNVIIGDEDVCYAINTGEGDGTQDVVVTNSIIKGWNSYGNAIKSVSFTNCTFAQGEYYTNVYGRLVKPYVNAVFDSCEFNSKYYIDLSALTTDGDGNVVNPDAKVVLKNCTVNGVKLTTDNWTDLIAPESSCGEGQISIEGKDGSYMSATNIFDYVVIE